MAGTFSYCILHKSVYSTLKRLCECYELWMLAILNLASRWQKSAQYKQPKPPRNQKHLVDHGCSLVNLLTTALMQICFVALNVFYVAYCTISDMPQNNQSHSLWVGEPLHKIHAGWGYGVVRQEAVRVIAAHGWGGWSRVRPFVWPGGAPPVGVVVRVEAIGGACGWVQGRGRWAWLCGLWLPLTILRYRLQGLSLRWRGCYRLWFCFLQLQNLEQVYKKTKQNKKQTVTK